MMRTDRVMRRKKGFSLENVICVFIRRPTFVVILEFGFLGFTSTPAVVFQGALMTDKDTLQNDTVLMKMYYSSSLIWKYIACQTTPMDAGM